MSTQRALSTTAFLTLLAIASMMGANHVAARLAFNHGTDVGTAVVVRSGVTALVLALLLWRQAPSNTPSPRQWRMLLLAGLLVGVQSLCVYSSVARLPVALALLAFNTFPIFAGLWAWLLYRQKPARTLLLAMPVLLAGLALALDVMGAASGLGARAQWQQIGAGLAFALAAAASFGLVLILTQHEVAGVDARLRTATTMALACGVALALVSAQGSWQLPQSDTGWLGLTLLTALYGTGITVLLAVLPRLGVVGNSPILNIEPVVALVLAWQLLGQTIAPVQIAGGLIVVATVMALGLRKR
jgi:drug/metabolite transporter (DMT)-like permease